MSEFATPFIAYSSRADDADYRQIAIVNACSPSLSVAPSMASFQTEEPRQQGRLPAANRQPASAVLKNLAQAVPIGRRNASADA